MTSPDYAWISFGWYFEKFWKDPYANRSSYDAFNHCTSSELESIVDQMILIDQYSRQDDKDSPTVIGDLVSKWTTCSIAYTYILDPNMYVPTD